MINFQNSSLFLNSGESLEQQFAIPVAVDIIGTSQRVVMVLPNQFKNHSGNKCSVRIAVIDAPYLYIGTVLK